MNLSPAHLARAYLGLGSNIGDKCLMVEQAIARLDAHPRIAVVARSRRYRTAPWGNTDQDWFVNACIGVDTDLAPRQLLAVCLDLEAAMGRVREQKWGPRLIDIDILDYAGRIIRDDMLTLPHPHMPARAFVLTPLAEIAPDLPVAGQRAIDAAKALDDGSIIPLP